MKSTLTIGQGKKGSKRMIQIVSSQSCSAMELGESIEWLSPKFEEDYREYQLNNQHICSRLGLNKSNKKLFGFWPSRQPQWDGLAFGERKKTLYLIEAKSHLSETYSSLHSTSKSGKTLIEKSINEVAYKVYRVENKSTINDYWLKRNYQIANRLVFLQKMKENISNATIYNQVKLVFLNFVDDYTLDDHNRVREAKKWDEHFGKIFKRMGISKEQVESEGVLIVNIPAPHL